MEGEESAGGRPPKDPSRTTRKGAVLQLQTLGRVDTCGQRVGRTSHRITNHSGRQGGQQRALSGTSHRAGDQRDGDTGNQTTRAAAQWENGAAAMTPAGKTRVTSKTRAETQA